MKTITTDKKLKKVDKKTRFKYEKLKKEKKDKEAEKFLNEAFNLLLT